ncbi:MAG: redox-regulated ATPase YchF [Caldiserica bacterium]|nr:MAG: redox-regulated ATPase YchF [Caldisericota bacterium]
MKAGICGLPNVGKSLLFKILTGADVSVDLYPFTTINPNIGEVEVEDENLEFFKRIYPRKKITKARIRIVDVAGLVKGASKGEGLGNQFLSHLRELDLLIVVLRFFHDENVSSTISKISPLEELEILKTEFALSDIEILERRKDKLLPKARSGDSDAKKEIQRIDELIDEISKKQELSEDIEGLISGKKKIFVINSDEKNFEEAKKLPIEPKVIMNLKLEEELKELSEDEKKEYRCEFPPFSTPSELIKKIYKELGFITFYTIKGEEVRAWGVEKGINVKKAAGKIHSDMEKNFIRAKCINFEEFREKPSWKELEEEGKIKIVGADYILKDKDIIEIIFKS